MPEDRLARSILDTSVVIGLDKIGVGALRVDVAVTAITMAELAEGGQSHLRPGSASRFR